ncbi:hypothetical protein COCCADRAFT_100623 [Bipolaris zeicola 26-R-13]|uniref:Cyanovirin-N domain-containing protein n=1 Tax=Cochliobolus carbonum (strain 26-R-13) TaxID=930089 RepID=W6YK87_COCC2|nr:uncharacterized protein COCCADRAFT_100623 [Bipolaris zeicola 26-R-13]EUC31676.1 hypothetical protein COCCADRAFT_100623 [Bipolaris zeicola 26-R-13]
MLLLPLSFVSASITDTPKTPQKKACGWELMQNLNISIASLGTLYAKQTGDRSLCTRQDDGSEYCTCIYECGNGVWSFRYQSKRHQDDNDDDHEDYDEEEDQNTTDVKDWTWQQGCGKYCHAGVCDGQV